MGPGDGTLLKFISSSDSVGQIGKIVGQDFCRSEDYVPILKCANPDKISLIYPLEDWESSIDGLEYRNRIRLKNLITFGSSAFLYFYNNQEKIPPVCKNRNSKGKTPRVTFDGVTFVSREDQLFSPYFFWAGNMWRFGAKNLLEKFDTNFASATYLWETVT